MRSVIRRARAEFKADDVTDLAAALTYYGVLAIVPGMIVLVAVIGLVGANSAQLLHQVSVVAPGSAAQVIQTLIRQAQHHHGGAGIAAIAGLVVALWSASGYVAAFMRAANRVYDIGEGRPIWKKAPLRLALTLFAVVMLVVMAALVVVTGSVARTVGNAIGVGGTAVTVWDIAKWPVLVVLISVLLAVLFWATPNAKQAGIKWISPGGVLATVAWLVVSAIFALYVSDFSSYNRTYGSMAGIVVFLVWLWLTNVSLLFGLELNAELERERAVEQGLPEGVEPFAEPRDTRKMSEEQRRAVEESLEVRRRTIGSDGSAPIAAPAPNPRAPR
ncbi:MAG TPA: YihY/virulence factor BrkB family protein [Solirubrobacteraceae bacterium]|nr:YihY/virulence factor BrkB family protein [Solirubrobacteraceae bacterium]